MKRIYLNELSLEELKALFVEVIREELNKVPKPQPNQDVLLSRKECALLLNCSLGSIAKYVRNGSLKAVRLPGSATIKIRKSDALASLNEIKTIKYSRQNNF